MTSLVYSDPSKMVCSDPPRMVCSDPYKVGGSLQTVLEGSLQTKDIIDGADCRYKISKWTVFQVWKLAHAIANWKNTVDFWPKTLHFRI